jgi:hypothetical protein
MALRFTLIKFSDVEITRRNAGYRSEGDWVEGTTETFTAQLKVQPVKPFELLQFPESDRSREWLKVYCNTHNLRSQIEGDGGWDADEFSWPSIVDGKEYVFKIMKTYRFKDSAIDHWKGWAYRTELTPN